MTTDPFAGEELTDGDLRGEIELVGDLVVAASDVDGHLTQAQIDEVLGVAVEAPAAPVRHEAVLPEDALHAEVGLHGRRRRAATPAS